MRPVARLQRARWLPLLAVVALAACGGEGGGGSGVTGPGGPTLPMPSIRLSAPTTLSVARGGTVTVPIDIARTDYTGVVFVNFTGLPTGVVAPSVSSTSTNRFAIPLRADSTAALGATTVRITGQGVDIPVVTVQFTLTVTPN
jgi:hypothetical protein